MNVRLPPQNPEAEQAVLSTLMLNPNAWDDVCDVLTPSMFYSYRNQVLFAAIEHLASNNKSIDAITVTEALERSNSTEDITLDAIADLMTSSAGNANCKDYADIVRDNYQLREMITAGNEITDMAFQADGMSAGEILNQAESKVLAIADKQQKSNAGPLPMSTVATQALRSVEDRRNNAGRLLGESWGMSDLDRITDGLQKNDLIILAGRPSMGKTSLAMNVAANVAIKSTHPKPVLIFSMEMSGEQLANRMQASIARISLGNVRNGSMSDSEWHRLTEATKRIQDGQMHVDETPALTPTEVRARARRLHRSTGELGLIVIDYLQLMQTHSKSDNRAAEISEISRSLKALAKELQVPVMALSQLNRGLESRPDKRPLMSDLRESGAIEQDADVIAFIYRDEVYNPETTWKGTAEVLFRKQRNGPTAMVRLSFNGAYTLFDSYIDRVDYEERAS